LLVVFTLVAGIYAFRGPASDVLDMGWGSLHMHSIGLGWSAMLAFAGFYYLLPRIWETRIRYQGWMSLHFWLNLTATLLYLAGHWWGAVSQAAAQRAVDDNGNMLFGFREAFAGHDPANMLRIAGGGLFVLGLLLLLANIVATRSQGVRERRELEALLSKRVAAMEHQHE